jgi:polysaccharide export outer membrane protein
MLVFLPHFKMRQSLLLLIVTLLAFSSCRFYRRDILFKASKEKEAEFAALSKQIKTPKNYLIQKNDYIDFQIFTNKGESIVDPTSEYQKQVNSINSAAAVARIKYLVQADGCADLPIIGHIKLDSLTIHQADSLLGEKYGKFYQDVFVSTKVLNQYVFVINNGTSANMGGGGGMIGSATLVELKKENTTFLELLTQMRGLGIFSHANRIKVIRGDLKNPLIFTINLSEWNSFQESNLVIQPNDVIYVEPARRRVFEFLRDASQLTGILSTVLSLYILTRL